MPSTVLSRSSMPPDRAPLRDWEAVDGALFIRTPEEEASGAWKPPTRAMIEANRARFVGYREWKSKFESWQRHTLGAFAAGFAAGVAHASTTAADPAQVAAMRELLREIDTHMDSLHVGSNGAFLLWQGTV